MDLAIETRGLRCDFGAIRAVDGIDLRVPSGSVFGFLGPNGSGKTTTIRLLLGLIRPDAGQAFLNGHELKQERAAALRGVGAIVETPALYPNLTGREILRMARRLLDVDANEIERVLDIVDLRAAADRRVKTYSLGMRQRLALARALMGSPRLLILDEPTNGLDPAGIADMRALIKSLPSQTDTTIFVSSHQLSEMEQMTDHCALIKSGRLLFQGRLDALMSQVPSVFEVETDDPEKGLAAAQAAGLVARVAHGALDVSGDLDRDARAALIAAMVKAGCGVSGARLRKVSLEQLFLSITSDEEELS